MFGQSNWKSDVELKFDQIEQKLALLQRDQAELKTQNQRLSNTLKTVTRKMILRYPVSLESLEKSLSYDLIFPEEVETWKKSTRTGVVLDIRPLADFNQGHLPDSLNIPFEQLASTADKLSHLDPILLICENGVKSVSASEQLLSQGFYFVYVLKGGAGSFRFAASEEKPVEGHA